MLTHPALEARNLAQPPSGLPASSSPFEARPMSWGQTSLCSPQLTPGRPQTGGSSTPSWGDHVQSLGARISGCPRCRWALAPAASRVLRGAFPVASCPGDSFLRPAGLLVMLGWLTQHAASGKTRWSCVSEERVCSDLNPAEQATHQQPHASPCAWRPLSVSPRCSGGASISMSPWWTSNP